MKSNLRLLDIIENYDVLLRYNLYFLSPGSSEPFDLGITYAKTLGKRHAVLLRFKIRYR